MYMHPSYTFEYSESLAYIHYFTFSSSFFPDAIKLIKFERMYLFIYILHQVMIKRNKLV